MRVDEPRPVWTSAYHALMNAGEKEIVRGRGQSPSDF